MIYGSFQSVEESSSSLEKVAERKLRTSKLKGLNSQLESLIQKKIRIDLEIQRTKKKLSKLKESSKTSVKASLSMEGFDYDSFSPEDNLNLQEKLPADYPDLLSLDEQIYRSEEILKEIEDLPLFE